MPISPHESSNPIKIEECRIGFVGFGHMAQALFQSINHAKLVPKAQIFFCQRDPDRMRRNQEAFGITATSLEHLAKTSDLLFLCVRPQGLEKVLEQLKGFTLHGTLFSIVAGATIEQLQTVLGPIPLIRAMPNLAVEVGEGLTALAFSKEVSSHLQSLSRMLFRAMGEVVEVKEGHMDLITALAGSSPAFLFALIESAARFGQAGGLPYEVARKVAAQAFVGTGRMALKSSKDLKELIHNIAVPNGTTEAGLRVFHEGALGDTFQSVLRAVVNRANEIARDIQKS